MNKITLTPPPNSGLSSRTIQSTSNDIVIPRVLHGNYTVTVEVDGVIKDIFPISVFSHVRKTVDLTTKRSKVTLNFTTPEVGGGTTPDLFYGVRQVNLSTYGGVGDGTTDNFNALKAAIDASVSEPLILELDAGTYFVKGGTNQRLEPWPNKSKGLRIVGKGDVTFKHKNNRDNERHEYYLMQMIMTPDSVGFEIDNIAVDGIENGQEELFYTIQPDSTKAGYNPIGNIPMARGFSVHGAHNVKMTNLRFKNMYGGQALALEEYRDVLLSNIVLDKVGGHDVTESFGTGIYISGHRGDAVINIDNVNAQGMVGSKADYLSWIGITFENGTIQSRIEDLWLVDINTTINVTNCDIIDYHAIFHIESWAGNVYFNTDDITARGSNYLVVAGVLGEYWEVSNNVKMDLLPFGHIWRIIKAVYHSDKEMEDNYSGLTRIFMHNSLIKYVPVTGFSHILGMAAYGNGTVANFKNTQFDNVPDVLVQNASAIFTDSVINLMQGNNKTAAQLTQSWMNDPRQKVVLNNTSVNLHGSHKGVINSAKPAKAAPTGHVPPPFTEPLLPPI